MWRRTTGGIAAVGLTITLATAFTAPASAEPASAAPALAEPAQTATGKAYDVTLPTGDKVHVSPSGVAAVTAVPRKDGYTPAFSVTQTGGDLYVVPDDQTSADPASFNVTALHEGRRPAVPAPRASDGLVTIRVKGIARDGRVGRGTYTVFDVEDGTRGSSRRVLPGDPDLPCTDASWDGSTCIRVPPGTYSITGVIETMPPWQSSTARDTPLNRSFVGHPEIEITEDTELVLDARRANEVKIDTPDHVTRRNRGALSHLMWTRTPQNGPATSQGVLMGGGSHLEERVFMQPAPRVRAGSFEIYTRWRLDAPSITMRAPGLTLSPEYVNPVYFSDVSSQYPRLDGTTRLRVADGDRPGADLRGRLALIRRSDGASVAEQSNRAAAAGARMVAIYNDEPGVNGDTNGSGIKLTVPTVRLSHEEGRALLSRAPVTVTAAGVVSSPYMYELLYPEKQQIPKKLHYVARTRDLARVRNDYYGFATMSTGRYSRRPWESLSTAYTFPFTGAPRSRIEYLSADQETQWTARAATPEEPYNHLFPDEDTPYVQLDESVWMSHLPGQRRTRTWFKAPLTGGLNPLSPIARTGDRLRMRVGLVDAAGNFSRAYSSNFPGGFATAFRVYQDEKLIASTIHLPNGSLNLPPDEATYRIEYDVDNHASWARLSTRTKTAWTFRSARPSGTETAVVPLVQIDYDADLDLNNRARSRTLNLTARHQDGSTTPLRRLSLAVSYDDGASWTKAFLFKTRNGYSTRLRGHGKVSLKIQAEDTAGNALSQEIIRAYALP
ncbi:PA domain-containing protein [Actinomadura sp. 6N118]|uniref:PA domain-containing protein n=1 Tax=Actinomadura sp. 6N118 TaxID=3375151 RepID=UPI0037AEE10C